MAGSTAVFVKNSQGQLMLVPQAPQQTVTQSTVPSAVATTQPYRITQVKVCVAVAGGCSLLVFCSTSWVFCHIVCTVCGPVWCVSVHYSHILVFLIRPPPKKSSVSSPHVHPPRDPTSSHLSIDCNFMLSLFLVIHNLCHQYSYCRDLCEHSNASQT